ncbi:MAG: ABC transporter permease, partial [Pseudomonadota bacterium]
RGFLLFLVMAPIVFLGVTLIFTVVEKARPERSFVVIDQAGGYIDLIDKELERQRIRELLQAWNAWLPLVIDPDKIDLDAVQAPFGVGRVNNKRIDDFIAAGGLDGAVKAVTPLMVAGRPSFVPPGRRFFRVEAPSFDMNTMEATAAALKPYLTGQQQLQGRELFAAIIIPTGFGKPAASIDAEPAEAEFWSTNITDPTLQISVTRALREALRRRAAEAIGLEGGDLKRISDIDAPMKLFNPNEAQAEDAEIDDVDRLEKVILPGMLTYSLLVIVFAVGNPLLTNTIEERSNKIVEVLLSSATANELMVGKLIGIGAVGLTMPLIFLLGGVLASAFVEPETEIIRETMGALWRSNLIPIYFFYFLSAYVIFAMVFLAIGAMSNSLQDAQTFMGPLMMVVFAPLPFAIMVFQNPNGLAATILTFIPLYTPYAVLLRISSDPPMWEIVGGTSVMLIFAVFVANLMGRVFKNNILNASPPKLGDIWKSAKRTTSKTPA